MNKYVALDIETTGLHHKTDTILCLAAHNGTKGLIFKGLGKIQVFFDSINQKGYKQVWFNGKFDVKFLLEAGIKGARIDEDVLALAALFPFEDKGLKELAMRILEVPDWSVNRKKMIELPEDVLDSYCIKDAEITLVLFHKLLKAVTDKGMKDYYYNLSMPFYKLLLEVEQEGVKLNTDLLFREKEVITKRLLDVELNFRSTYKTLLDKVERELKDEAIQAITCKTQEAIERHKKAIEETYMFNLNSSVQMSKLFREIRIAPKDKKGKFTTSSKTLKYYFDRHPVLIDVVKYRQIVKTSQFLNSWHSKLIEGRIYGSYNVHTVDTGRLSSSQPNLQQVPKDSSLRSIFEANEGKVWVLADYAQIEPRMMAHFTEDSKLIKIFKNNTDIYAYLATRILGCKCELSEVKEKFPQERQIAKALTLAIMYGMGARALSYVLTVEQSIPTTIDTARTYIKAFYNHFSKVKPYQETLGYSAMQSGYILGFNGRRLWLKADEARHKAFNYINQNAASELCAFSQMAVTKDLKNIAKLRLITHDEVIYECSRGDVDNVVACLNRHMVDRFVGVLKVPLKLDVHVGTTWEAKNE